MHFTPLPLREDEYARLSALLALGVLDTAPEATFDHMISLAAAIWDVPIAALSLVDADRQWFKARMGLADDSTSRDVSFCAHAIANTASPLIVEDALLDPRFAGNPLVTGPLGIRFYAGCAVFDDHGYPLGAVCVIDRKPRTATPALVRALEDIAAVASGALVLRRSVVDLARAASTDHLTGALNRNGLEQKFATFKAGVAVLMLDLDRFKAVNDTYGHACGDELLVLIVARLRSVLRPEDVIARMGGDEFVILAHCLDPDHATSLAARIRLALEQPWTSSSPRLSPKVSIGSVFGDCREHSLAALIEQADVQLYRNKAERHGDMIAGASAIIGRNGLREQIKHALRAPEENFELHYQPIFSISTGAVTSCEALVRWRCGDQLLAPGVFLPVVDELGAAPDLDFFVLRQAAADHARLGIDVPVAINLSGQTLATTGFADELMRTATSVGMGPSTLAFELTESSLMQLPETSFDEMKQLAAAGYTLALDDFGAGQTALLQLQRLPISKLKLDRALVRTLSQTGQTALLEGIARIADALKLIVVAEGIENVADLKAVAATGVHRGQGYGLAKPVAANELQSAFANGSRIIALWLNFTLAQANRKSLRGNGGLIRAAKSDC
jgi:diguanylate cyclase (GGDEF)-like protein